MKGWPMAAETNRPLSPHLGIWRWGPAMLVSILHRVTGGALSVVGLAILVWWLSAIAGGDGAYRDFLGAAGQWFGLVVLIGISWAFFQHLLSGIRHLFTDAGQAFELDTNKTSANATIILSLLLTIALWAWLLGVGR
jgi:succinate dehydrogenase / fumarate reductase cytochrome b subunit